MKLSMFKVLTILGLTLVSFVGVAQQATNYQRQYLNAKSLFKEKRYNLAMSAFKPLIPKNSTNPFSAYAAHFYALSAYHQGYLPIARDMFLQIERNYPGWKNLEESYYWLGVIYLERSEFDKALTVFAKIKDRTKLQEIQKIKRYYFSRIRSESALKELYRANPNDSELGGILAQRISEQPYGQQDHRLLDKLIDRFRLDKENFVVADIPRTEMKSSYSVLVLLPFMGDDLEPTLGRKRHQFVLDLFEGTKMAVEKLSDEGVTIELKAYDTKKSEVETKKILQDPQLNNADLIIGPLYQGPSKVALDFSFRNKINIINPLSFNSKITAQNPFSFLYKPSNETVGKHIAAYAAHRLEKHKQGIILYEDNEADSIRAANYHLEALEQGYNIALSKAYRPTDTRAIMDFFTALSENRLKTDEGRSIYVSNIGSIFVSSQNRVFAANIATAMDVREEDITLIAPYEWLNFVSVDFDIYQRLGALLYAPDFFDVGKEDYQEVRDNYIEKYARVPESRVFIGYDMMMHYGRSLGEYGKYFQHKLYTVGRKKGALKLWHDYTNANDNQIVPVAVFEEGEMTIDIAGKDN